MPRHDYDLPPDFDELSDKEKSRWMTQERCRRLHNSMRKANNEVSIEKLVAQKQRIERVLDARGYKDLDEMR